MLLGKRKINFEEKDDCWNSHVPTKMYNSKDYSTKSIYLLSLSLACVDQPQVTVQRTPAPSPTPQPIGTKTTVPVFYH